MPDKLYGAIFYSVAILCFKSAASCCEAPEMFRELMAYWQNFPSQDNVLQTAINSGLYWSMPDNDYILILG